jgi:hypothetical protein
MSEFTVPRPNLYESSKGYSVEILGRTGLRYIEGGRALFVDSEILAEPGGILVYRDSIRSWDPDSAVDPLSEAARARVVDNICAALGSHGIAVDVI